MGLMRDVAHIFVRCRNHINLKIFLIVPVVILLSRQLPFYDDQSNVVNYDIEYALRRQNLAGLPISEKSIAVFYNVYTRVALNHKIR